MSLFLNKLCAFKYCVPYKTHADIFIWEDFIALTENILKIILKQIYYSGKYS